MSLGFGLSLTHIANSALRKIANALRTRAGADVTDRDGQIIQTRE